MSSDSGHPTDVSRQRERPVSLFRSGAIGMALLALATVGLVAAAAVIAVVVAALG